MSEKHKDSQGLRQPLAELPEVTGNPITDKANMWLYVASWSAAATSREMAVRRSEDEAARTGQPRPTAQEIGQPDFTEDDTTLLTKVSALMDDPNTQIMLATLYDLRETALENQENDIIGQQMLTMRVILNNPNLSALR